MTTSNVVLVSPLYALSLLLLLLPFFSKVLALSAPRTFLVRHSDNHFESNGIWTSTGNRETSSKRSTTNHSYQLWRETYHTIANPLGTNLVAINTTTTTIQVNALLAIKKSIQIDPFGALANWTNEENSTYCSAWKGVDCDEMGNVISIKLTDLRLNGTINSKIGNLMHLSYLNMSGNSLFGNIPFELMKCRNLVAVDLSFNYLDGELSAGYIYTLPKLEFMRLSYNSFSGLLPEVPENSCYSLTNLRITYTNLFGAIPSSLNRCKNLTALLLDFNQLNGSIPTSFGDLHQLVVLVLQGNQLTGNIPNELASLKNLQILVLGYNNLEGPIPTWLGGITSLVKLYLGVNQFTGNIPSQLAFLKNLQILVLENNYLQDSIPTSLGGITSLVQLWPANNRLAGEIPIELGSLKKLEVLDLQTN
ncbi:hypothetical protein KC19_2G170500, partial [Ceratodon purpureus]